MDTASGSRVLVGILFAFLVLSAVSAWADDFVIGLDPGDAFVIQDSTATDQLRVDEFGNVDLKGGRFLHSPGNVNNTGVGLDALNPATTGNQNAAFGYASLGSNTTGTGNTAVGRGALFANTGSSYSTAVGYNALLHNTASWNSAVGMSALETNSTGLYNSAFGYRALYAMDTNSSNTAMGYSALTAALGSDNTAVGANALIALTTGADNIAIGANAGSNVITSAHSIHIGNTGQASDNSVIRIGNTQAQTYIAGIYNAEAASGFAVYVNSNGHLGTSPSSLRFKKNVRSMGDVSETLMKLRPVSFEYRDEIADDPEVRHYGLIAEEVAKVAPELVIYDEGGEAYGVRYQFLAPMLLGEVQRQQAVIEDQAKAIASLTARLDALEGGVRDGQGADGANR